MGAQPPYMYQAVTKNDERFPAAKFDPKAVTRASYEPKKLKAKPDGPLVSFGRHPDAHMIPNGRSSKYKPVGYRTKGWIKGLRVVQLCLRVLQAVGAAGLIVVMSLSGLIGWVLGVTLGVVVVHCLYSSYHHARPAGGRAPGSSAAYQVFSGVSDLCVLPLYAYGVYTTRNKREEWEVTPPKDANVMKYMVPAVYYGLIGAGGLHLLSMVISLWLGFMFRRISLMPPDMNPLEANYTSRVHKRNKSSIATTSTFSESEKQLDSQPYDDQSRPPPIPFMHTRQGSETSFGTRDSRVNLPSRQYQVAPGSPTSVTSPGQKRMSAPPSSLPRASYMEIPLAETGAKTSRPTSVYSGSVPSGRPESVTAPQTTQPRSARFTETWYASESLVNRTQQRMNQAPPPGQRHHYATLDPDSDSDTENNNYRTFSIENDDPDLGSSPSHPNPLRSNPTPATTSNPTTPTKTPASRPRTPFSRLRASILSEVPLNDRRVSGSQDITDSAKQQQQQPQKKPNFEPRDRLSSIQADASFYAKPYGELRPGTPPVMVGSKSNSRQVSSGNDYESYDLGEHVSMGRRRVSGKVAEEGRAGKAGERDRWARARFGVLN